LKFRRQLPLGKYIVDFVCLEKRLIIELGGGQHNAEAQRQYESSARSMVAITGVPDPAVLEQ
jgi:very-short-patch-repair endonuclease